MILEFKLLSLLAVQLLPVIIESASTQGHEKYARYYKTKTKTHSK